MLSFSGIDCAGKTTQIELLEKYYSNHGIKVRKVWARGRCTPGVVLIKNIVRKDKHLDERSKNEYLENIHKSSSKRKMLLIASILDLYWFFGIYYRILNLLCKNLICDRYIWDTYIDFKVDYSEFGFEKWIIWQLLVRIIPQPKKSFMFIISPDESLRRGIEKKEAGLQSIERKTQKIDKYLELVKQSKWTNVIDGTNSVDKIFNEIKEVLKLEY